MLTIESRESSTTGKLIAISTGTGFASGTVIYTVPAGKVFYGTFSGYMYINGAPFSNMASTYTPLSFEKFEFPSGTVFSIYSTAYGAGLLGNEK